MVWVFIWFTVSVLSIFLVKFSGVTGAKYLGEIQKKYGNTYRKKGWFIHDNSRIHSFLEINAAQTEPTLSVTSDAGTVVFQSKTSELSRYKIPHTLMLPIITWRHNNEKYVFSFLATANSYDISKKYLWLQVFVGPYLAAMILSKVYKEGFFTLPRKEGEELHYWLRFNIKDYKQLTSPATGGILWLGGVVIVPIIIYSIASGYLFF